MIKFPPSVFFLNPLIINHIKRESVINSPGQFARWLRSPLIKDNKQYYLIVVRLSNWCVAISAPYSFFVTNRLQFKLEEYHPLELSIRVQLVRLTREGEEKRRVFGIPPCAKIRNNELYWLELEEFVRNFISFRSKSADIERRSFKYKYPKIKGVEFPRRRGKCKTGRIFTFVSLSSGRRRISERKKKEGKDGRKTTFPVNLSGHQYTLTRDLVSVV